MTAQTSAIVVNYNGGAITFPCIDSLLDDEVDEIVVVDNGSSDGSPALLQDRYGDRVRLLEMGYNAGFARACNAGARIASRRFLLFFNNDAYAHRGMTQTLVNALEANPDVAVAGPTVLEASDPTVVQSAGWTVDRWGFPVNCEGALAREALEPAGIRDAFFVSGCALLVEKHNFARLGGFDDGMFMFCEDVDLCWRARMQGWRVVTVRAAHCRHIGGATAEMGVRSGTYRTSAFRIREREANTFRMMLVNLEPKALLAYLVIFYPFWIVEAVVALLVGRKWIARAYVEACVASITSLPSILRRRREVQRARTIPDSYVLALWSRRYEKLRVLRRVGVPSQANHR